MSEEIRTVEEVYEWVIPAVRSIGEVRWRSGFTDISGDDIWNYLKEKKWTREKGLSLYQMVDDILNSESSLIDDYLKSKLNLRVRKTYFEERD